MATGFPTKANWAAGDVLTASAMDDLAGTVNLLSNASAASGSQLISNAAGTSFAYQATPSASNPVLNSAFQIWQRGTASTSIATSGTFFLADRWQAVRGGYAAGGSVSRQATNDTTNLPFIQYAQRVQRDSGNTSTATLISGQNFESINSIPFAGKTVTLSYYARAGANYSPTSSALATYLNTGTGTDQNDLTSSFTGLAAPINGTAATLTTTWQRFSFTATLSSTATQICIQLVSNPTGTAGANDYFEFTGVQLDIGSVALPFRTNQPTIATELAACQRYYWTPTVSNNNCIGYAYATNATIYDIPFPVNLRISPTSLITSGTIFAYALNSPTGITPTFDMSGTSSAQILGAITIIAGQGSRMQLPANSIAFSAEL